MALTSNIHEVEGLWREFEGKGVQSLTQSFDYVQLWAEHFGIAEDQRVFLTAGAHGQPLLLIPLRRARWMGAKVLTWLSGAHIGCQAPAMDAEALAALDEEQRGKVWEQVRQAAAGADFLFLPGLPAGTGGSNKLFDGLGHAAGAGRLFRAEFGSIEEAVRFSSGRDRRQRDRQEAQRLTAMGEVKFMKLSPGSDFAGFFDAMFKLPGAEHYANTRTRRFLKRAFEGGLGLGGRLCVLELDNAPIAFRFGLAVGDRLFLMAATSSEDVRVRGISPGSQCLRRALEAAFTSGTRIVDMGAGMTEEKRMWCNTEIMLEDRYVPLTRRGRFLARLHRLLHRGENRP